MIEEDDQQDKHIEEHYASGERGGDVAISDPSGVSTSRVFRWVDG